MQIESAASTLTPSVNIHDEQRLLWCIETLNDIKSLGRNAPLQDLYPAVLMVIATLKKVLEPNLNES